jgi:hypothetical protein
MGAAATGFEKRGAVVSACLACGKLIPRKAGAYCQAHVPVSRTARARGSGAARERFRREVLAAAGGRCQAVEHGVRCIATDGLEAHHLRPLKDGGSNDPSNGVALCRSHHARLSRKAA